MDILAALRQEEAKWETQVSTAQQQLENGRAAIKPLGGLNSSKVTVSGSGKTTGRKKQVMSAAARAEDFEGDKRAVGEV